MKMDRILKKDCGPLCQRKDSDICIGEGIDIFHLEINEQKEEENFFFPFWHQDKATEARASITKV